MNPAFSMIVDDWVDRPSLVDSQGVHLESVYSGRGKLTDQTGASFTGCVAAGFRRVGCSLVLGAAEKALPVTAQQMDCTTLKSFPAAKASSVKTTTRIRSLEQH
ncbi:unnamed protein product [Pleuronectes platessa]|uniref:Uncharacterized protein n=1 Tax=Pleuronectes platessa TaxID=8262 RepID=A0A9N7TMN7_PLEPL|nr:unnamed protein product [Pleuronectes platessa]